MPELLRQACVRDAVLEFVREILKSFWSKVEMPHVAEIPTLHAL